VKASKPDEISILCIKDGFGRGGKRVPNFGLLGRAHFDHLWIAFKTYLLSRVIYLPCIDPRSTFNIAATITMTDPIPTSRGSSLAYPEMVRSSSILA